MSCCWNFAMSFYIYLNSSINCNWLLREKIFFTQFKCEQFAEKLKCVFEPFDGHVWTNRENLTTDAFWKEIDAETHRSPLWSLLPPPSPPLLLQFSRNRLGRFMFIHFARRKSSAHTLRISQLSVWMSLCTRCDSFESIPTTNQRSSAAESLRLYCSFFCRYHCIGTDDSTCWSVVRHWKLIRSINRSQKEIPCSIFHRRQLMRQTHVAPRTNNR